MQDKGNKVMYDIGYCQGDEVSVPFKCSLRQYKPPIREKPLLQKRTRTNEISDSRKRVMGQW